MKSHKNYEVEVKLRIADRPALLGQLKKLGARCIGRVHELNTLFDTPRRALRQSGRLLRLRVVAPARWAGRRTSPASPGLVTYKVPAGRITRYKIREEIEVSVLENENVGPILEGLGLHPWFRYEKFRTSFRLPGHPRLHFELDETPIGVFVELEGPPRSIDRVARILGRGPGDYVTANYFSLYRAACRRRGLPVRDMLFPTRKK